MNTATFIKSEKTSKGEMRLYKLSVPQPYGRCLWDEDVEKTYTEYVMVSAIYVAFDTGRPETYIFPADKDGKIMGWGEMDGSFQGGYNHERALRNAGFKVVEE